MIVIHIGLHKTGTSTIQHFVEANDHALEGAGVLFARVGRHLGYAHSALAGELVGSIHFRARTGTWAQVAALARKHPDRHVLVSAEALSNLDLAQIAPLRERLAGFAVRVVVYVRDLGTWVTSQYRQRTKTGKNLADFDKFFVQMGDVGRLDLFTMIEPWGRTFGWNNVMVRQLDGPSLHGGGLLSDFLHILGIDLAALPQIAPDSQVRRNISAGWKVLETVRHIHNCTGGPKGSSGANAERENIRDDRKLKRVYGRLFASCLDAAESLGLNDDAGQYLTAAQARSCHDAYAAAIDRFNAVGADLQSPAPKVERERPFLPSIEHIPPEELSQLLLRLLLAALDPERPSARSEMPRWLRPAQRAMSVRRWFTSTP